VAVPRTSSDVGRKRRAKQVSSAACARQQLAAAELHHALAVCCAAARKGFELFDQRAEAACRCEHLQAAGVSCIQDVAWVSHGEREGRP